MVSPGEKGLTHAFPCMAIQFTLFIAMSNQGLESPLLPVNNYCYINLHTFFPSPSFLTMDPPPNAMLKTSGIRKLVVTPPHFTLADASLGNPFCNTPTSVDVPPISTTMASLLLDKNAAPRMLLVGPEENVKTGNSELFSALHCGGDNELIENKIFNCFFKPFLFNFSLHAYMYIINFNYTTI